MKRPRKTKKKKYQRFADEEDEGSSPADEGEKSLSSGQEGPEASPHEAAAASEEHSGKDQRPQGELPLDGGEVDDSPPQPSGAECLPAPTVLGRPSGGDAADGGAEIKDKNGLEIGEADEETGKRPKMGHAKSLASSRRTFINAIICFIGTGMYGLPIAFKQVGTLGGLMGMLFVSCVSLHCMYLVVDCRVFLEQEKSKQIKTYGDIGYYAFGPAGQRTVDFFVMLTQVGFCIAYLIIISQSMHEVIHRITKRTWIILCMPMLIWASWLRSLKSIAPLSLLAELGSGAAAIIVLVFDVGQIFSNESGHALTHDMDTLNETLASLSPTSEPAEADNLVVLNLKGIPYFFGVSLYTFEGIGMVIPVYNSMRDTTEFKMVWGMALAFVAMLNTAFGFLGYYAYRSGVADIIISNLPHVRVTIFMKVSLCMGLFFTYPIMLFPVIEMMEDSLERPATTTRAGAVRWNVLRSLLVLVTGMIASLVPRFSFFIALIGASGGAALAFVLPSAFHLKLRYEELDRLRRWRESFCIIVGVAGGLVGTIQAVGDLREALE